MSGPDGISRLLFAATAAVVSAFVVAACAIQLRGDDDSAVVASSLTQLRDPVTAELARCQTITLELQAGNFQPSDYGQDDPSILSFAVRSINLQTKP